MGTLLQWIAGALRQLGVRGTLAAIGVMSIAYFFVTYGPAEPELTPVQQHLVHALSSRAVSQFPDQQELGMVLFVPVEGDWGDSIWSTVRRVVREQGLFELAPEPATARMLKDLHLYSEPKYDQDKLDSILGSMDQSTLLVGKLLTYEENREEAFGELNFLFIDKATGQVDLVHASHRLRKSMLNPEYFTMSLRLAPFGQRLLLWAILVLFFPLLMAPLTIWIVRRGNLIANLVLVAAYTTALLSCTMFIIGPVTSWWQGALMLLALLFILSYVIISSAFLANRTDLGPRF